MLVVNGLVEIDLESKKPKNDHECFETLHDGKFQTYAKVQRIVQETPGFLTQFEELRTQGRCWSINTPLSRLF